MDKDCILVVDDELLIRDLLFEFFTAKGYTVMLAENGRKAIEIVRSDPFDVALIDLRMPGIDGMKVIEEIRQVSQEVPIIIMTGYPSFNSAIKALRERVYDYIVKPFQVPHLALVVERAIKEYRLIQQNKELREDLRRAEQELEKLRGDDPSGLEATTNDQ